MKISIFILFTCFFQHFLHAQEPVVNFRNLTRANGLSHDKVNAIIQDSRGFIWIGTEDGLNRYDGSRFDVYRHDPRDSSTLSGNIITDLHEDKNGILWIATSDGGLSRYDYRLPPDKQFRQFTIFRQGNRTVAVNVVNDILEDQLGFLWLATSGEGVLRFEKESQVLTPAYFGGTRTILKLALDKYGLIWVGRQGGGLSKIDPKTFKHEQDTAYLNVYAKLPHMTVSAIYPDNYNYVWMGSWDKVIYRQKLPEGKDEIFSPVNSSGFETNDDPLSFAEDIKGNLLIGMEKTGLYYYNRRSEQVYNYRHSPSRAGSLCDNHINTIYSDREGIIWIGTNKGISIRDPAGDQFRQEFLGNADSPLQIYDMLQLNDSLLLGTSTGLILMNSGLKNRKIIPLKFNGEDLAVTSFYLSAKNDLYIGTNISVFQLNRKNFSLIPLKNTRDDVVMRRIIESRVVSMIEDTLDGNPVLLVSPYGHFLAYYDFISQRWVSRQDSTRDIVNRFGLRENLIQKIYRSSHGIKWLANSKMGLGEWKANGKIRYYTTESDSFPISNNNVVDIAEGDSGILWISTYGGGLNKFHPASSKFEHIGSTHNLAEGLALDLKQRVWMIANGNIHKYDPSTKTYSSFQLPDIERSGGVHGKIYTCAENRMFVAGLNYLISFDPDSIQEQASQPEVIFTDFRIFNSSYNQLLFQDRITLQYDQNFFSVDFSAPNFKSGYPVRYAHMLEGIDEDWIDDGFQNTVNYTNLDGGNYTLRIRATNQQGSWPVEHSTLHISIIPPFWKTWLFYLLVAVLASALVYSIYRYRLNVILKQENIRNKIARDLHDNLGSTLSSISVYGQVAKIYQSQQRMDELHDTLVKISTTSAEMISEMNDIVWAINPGNDNFRKIVQRMESFARPLLSSRNISLHFSVQEENLPLNLEMTKRKNFYLIYKETINNAVKYSAAKNLWVDIHVEQHRIRMIVKDDGKGFEPGIGKNNHSLSGNGLDNMQNRSTEMRGILIISSDPGKGTIVDLSFPIP